MLNILTRVLSGSTGCHGITNSPHLCLVAMVINPLQTLDSISLHTNVDNEYFRQRNTHHGTCNIILSSDIGELEVPLSILKVLYKIRTAEFIEFSGCRVHWVQRVQSSLGSAGAELIRFSVCTLKVAYVYM